MKQNIVRLMILGVLIMLCIWQTAMLWLGDMSGHNFFASSVASYEINYVHPKQVWCNIQGNIKNSIRDGGNSGIYRVQNEKEELLKEFIKEIRKGNLTIEKSSKEQYGSLLNKTQGIIFEFATKLTLEEIIGQNLSTRLNKYEAVKIKEIYVDLSASNAYKTYVYLIDEEAKIRQKIMLTSQLKAGIEIVNLYADKENVGNYQVYQASINSTSDRDFFMGNTFYPQMASTNAVRGSVIEFKPIIEDIEGKELENYVNYLFKNPANKNCNIIETGIAFSDNLSISVKYHQPGILEFQKTIVNDNEKLSHVERLNKVNTFINESGAIPEFLKKGVYLEDIFSNAETGETTYRYGYRYEDGQIVVLSDKAKVQLGIDSFLELSIKSREVTSGKWIMFEPYEVGEEVSVTMGSSEAINAIYENSTLTAIEEFKLESLDCVHRIDDIWKKSKFGWVGLYMEQPINTIEKIDNE